MWSHAEEQCGHCEVCGAMQPGSGQTTPGQEDRSEVSTQVCGHMLSQHRLFVCVKVALFSKPNITRDPEVLTAMYVRTLQQRNFFEIIFKFAFYTNFVYC